MSTYRATFSSVTQPALKIEADSLEVEGSVVILRQHGTPVAVLFHPLSVTLQQEAKHEHD